MVEALNKIGDLSSRGLGAPPLQFQPSDNEREDTPDSPASNTEKSLEQAKADIKRLKAEVSVLRKKIRAGGRLLKRLTKEHNVQLEVDPVTWEPVSNCPLEDPAVKAP